MLKSFIKTAFRSLWKNRSNSALNITGLAVGICCAGLIFLWVEHEVSYDQTFPKKDRLYYVMVNQNYDAGVFTHGSTPAMLGPALRQEVPGIANTCRADENNQYRLFSIGDKSMYASGRFCDSAIFSMFSLSFLQGNATTAFAQLYSIVITKTAAEKFFGTATNVVGKSVRMDNQQNYTVSAVINDVPQTSTLQVEWLASFEITLAASPWMQNWGNFNIATFVEVEPGANIAAINKQLSGIIQKREPKSIGHPFLFNMNDWHLRRDFSNGKMTGNGQIQYVRLFSLIAWIILVIACINFMNLSTAQSEKRAREVGVRKVLGAGKNRLVLQFMGEAMVTSLFAGLLAVVLISLVLPSFNGLVAQNLQIALSRPRHIIAMFAIVIICGLVAGSYPSLYLSSFQPIKVLKGAMQKTGSSGFIRKGLVVLQFAVSIILIVCTIIIYQQIQHVKQRDLGFNKNNLIEMTVQGDVLKNYVPIKQSLLATGQIENVALTDHSTIYGGNNTDGMKWPGKDPNAQILVSVRAVSPEFFSTYGMHIAEGRDFYADAKADSLHVIITESLAKLMGKGSAIGKTLQSNNESPGPDYVSYTITGVVKDYVYGNMYTKSDPVVFFCKPEYGATLTIRIKDGVKSETALTQIAAITKKYNPAFPFNYSFVSDQFDGMFQSEMLIGRLSRIFAGLAILISCLGLFGLASYTAERRTKEIGIRKVLGASVKGIAVLLSAEFLRLVAIAAIVAFPVAWWAMHSWLQGFPYRIVIGWWVFVIAGFAAVSIAVITVSFQSVRAALMNPVKSLRTE